MRDKETIRTSATLPLRGAVVYLREVTTEDVTPVYAEWMNDQELTQYMESRFTTHTIYSLNAFVQAKLQSPNEWLFAICLNSTSKHIGNIKLGPINSHHNRADIGLIIGDRNCHGCGFATQSIRLLANFAFDVLNIQKLTAGMYAGNVGSRRAFEKAGFHQEGLLRSQYCLAGSRTDGYLYGLTQEQHKAKNSTTKA